MRVLLGPGGILFLGTFISGLAGALATALLLLARNRHRIDMLRHDITAQREVQRRLTESVKLLQRAENVSRVGGFMIDIASGEQQWTAQTFRIHDVDENVSPTQKLVETFLLPEVRERLRDATFPCVSWARYKTLPIGASSNSDCGMRLP
jgi:hypothetical protein